MSCGRIQGREDGFTLVEVILTLVLAVLTVYSLQSTLQSAIGGQKTNDQVIRTWDMARDYLDRIGSIPFGRSSDPAPSSSMLDELFDGDQDLGTITLHQLAVPFDQAGHTFGVSADGLVGVWRIKVSSDIDRDGALSTPREGRSDLLAVEIYFDDTLQAHTLRAADPTFTQVDVGVDYSK